MKRALTPKPARKRAVSRRSVPGAFIALIGVTLSVSSCQGSYELERDEPCRQAGFAIASRNQACNGDADHANALYERFVDEYLCSVSELSQDAFRCAYNINALDCKEVASKGDDLNGYLSANGCSQILLRKDGEPIPGANSITATPICADLVFRLAVFESACRTEPANALYQLIAADLGTDHTCNISAKQGDLDTCFADLDSKRCIDFGIAREFRIRRQPASPSCPSRRRRHEALARLLCAG
ncbi:MAG: hypothetical protein R3B07_21735 [Polyangiaceae bacterium]